MNLTAVRDRDEAWTRHVEDSLALVPVIERWAARATGAGAGGAGAPFASSASASASSEGAGSVAATGGGRGKKGGAAAARGSDRRKKQQQQLAWFEQEDDEDDEPQAPPTPPAAAAGPEQPPSQPTTNNPIPSTSLRLIDVGTGPGLPGMVLAIARPQWRVTLLDSLRKRCDFLRAAAAQLNLDNVDVVWSRAEDAGRQPALRDAHDVAVARAVAESRVLAELCLPFVRPGGVWVAAKGAAIEGEVEAAGGAIAALRGRVVAIEAVDSFYGTGAVVPAEAVAAAIGAKEDGKGGDDAATAAAAAPVRRTAIVVEKLGPTPAAYPRPPGTPSKKPL